jgi:hypothetical protein
MPGAARAHGRDHPPQIRRRQVGAGGQAEAVAEEGFGHGAAHAWVGGKDRLAVHWFPDGDVFGF